jgi:hypothetical protein
MSRAARGPAALAALAVAVVAALAAAPALGDAAAHRAPGLAEGPVDGVYSVFYYVVAARRLAGSGAPGWVDELWFPVGRPLLLSQQNIVDALLAAPLVALFGAGRGTALLVALLQATNALSGAWLGARVGRSGAAAVAGAAVLGFSPYVLDELARGRYTQAWLAPGAWALGAGWSLAVAAAGGADARARARGGVLLGLAVAATAYHYWFYALFVGVVLLAVLPARGGRAVLAPAALGAAVALLAVAPFAAFVALAWEEVPGASTRPPFAPAIDLAGGLGAPGPGPVYLPHALLLAAALGAVFARGARLPALAALGAAGLLVAFAHGDSFRIAGQKFWGPYHYFVELPFFHRFWWPQRALGAATLALLVPVALLARAAVPAGSRPARVAAPALALLAAALSAAQAARSPGWSPGWAPLPSPAWHAALPAGPVLVLPMSDFTEGVAAARAWPAHQRPLVNGMSMWTAPLWPPGFRAWFDGDRALTALWAAESGRPAAALPSTAGALEAAGVVGIVWREGAVRPAQRSLLDARYGAASCRAGVCWWALPTSAEPR